MVQEFVLTFSRTKQKGSWITLHTSNLPKAAELTLKLLDARLFLISKEVVLVIRAPTTVDHKEAPVVETKMVTEGEETVVEDMETEAAKVVVAEEEALAIRVVARGEMNGIMVMEEAATQLVEEVLGKEMPVVAEEEELQVGAAVVVLVGPKILLLTSLPCTRSNFSMTTQLRSLKTPQMAGAHQSIKVVMVRSFILQISATTPMSTLSWITSSNRTIIQREQSCSMINRDAQKEPASSKWTHLTRHQKRVSSYPAKISKVGS